MNYDSDPTPEMAVSGCDCEVHNEYGQQHVLNLPLQPRTRTARTILGYDTPPNDQPILERALEEFLLKNADYEDSSDDLGLIGEISCLNKKMKKLARGVIRREPLNGEDASSLLQDIFGHTLLALYYQREEELRAVEDKRQQEAALAEKRSQDARETEEFLEMNRESRVSTEDAQAVMVAELTHAAKFLSQEAGMSWTGIVNVLNDALYPPNPGRLETVNTLVSDESSLPRTNFMLANGCVFVEGSWKRPAPTGASWFTVCGAKHPGLDVWCLSSKNLSSRTRHRYRSPEGTEYTWPDPEKAKDW